MAKAHNFFAGPAVLPKPVLEAAAKAVTNYKDLGMGVVEISHRSKDFVEIHDQAVADMKELMGLGDDHHVLFLSGGASTQFALVPMNFLHNSADFIDTGRWSIKAIDEAQMFGNVNVPFSGKDNGYSAFPTKFEFDEDADYVHVTSNNTVAGTQMKVFPETNAPLVCDMSSDMLSRELNFSDFGFIYAGAQKNMGPAGVTVVIIRNDLLEKQKSGLPTMMRYSTHVKKASAYNTPPVYGVFMVGQVLKWIKDQGGVKAVEKVNEEKAGMLYDVLDKYELFKPHAHKDVRSTMNVTWRMSTEELESEFLALASEHNMYGLKGHRSVGGLRASIYNACPVESVKALCELLEDFGSKNS
ncbi:MAG: 3-phosphoserine/phosphohydroxythreonine transaminase [Planctomycetota bacterium]|nr:3-phosphoserine/phosphohydroxythreonine transaminase [Planctomycetota bacterium]